MGQTIRDLNDAERRWVGQNVELATDYAESLGIRVDAGETLGPDALDAAWSVWLEGHAEEQDDPNPYINLFGVAFGAHLVRRLGLEWKVVSDEQGTEIAVWGRDGDILVFPPNLVAKRYDEGTHRFFADVAAWIEERVGQVRTEAAGSDKGPGRVGRFFRRGP